MRENDQDRMLYESAPLAYAKAAELCTEMPGSGHTCAWYHGVWQYLRILDVVASPWVQSDFYVRVLKALSATGNFQKVLISGASDYAMLRTLLEAYRAGGKSPQVSVVDRCQTPLFLNRWFAERESLELTTVASDLLDYRSPHLFDVICTHSFFGNFPPELRAPLVAQWRDLLRPGGKVVTMNRIRPGTEDRQGFSAAMADGFVKRVLQAGRREQARLGILQETLESWARVYTARYVSYPVPSAEGFRALFTDHGFRLDCFDLEGSPGKTSGPSMPGQAMRVYLVATRR